MTIKRFGIVVWLLVCGFCFSAPPARASLLTHSDVHVHSTGQNNKLLILLHNIWYTLAIRLRC